MLNGSHLSFLQKRLGFIEGRGKTNDKKNLSWFVVVNSFYQTRFEFSITSPRLAIGDRKHTTGWIKTIYHRKP